MNKYRKQLKARMYDRCTLFKDIAKRLYKALHIPMEYFNCTYKVEPLPQVYQDMALHLEEHHKVILKHFYDTPHARGYMPYRRPGKQVTLPCPGTITICPDKASLESMVSKRKAMGVPEHMLRDGLFTAETYRGYAQPTITIDEFKDIDPGQLPLMPLYDVKVTFIGTPRGDSNVQAMFKDFAKDKVIRDDDMFVDIPLESAQLKEHGQ